MRLTIYAVGALRTRELRSLADEYKKRLSRYARVTEKEVRDARARVAEAARTKEADALRAAFGKGVRLVTLTETGQSRTSPELARWIDRHAQKGNSHLGFVIGGPEGLDRSLIHELPESLSLSPMTFPHEMARMMLFEQLYRAFTILRNEPYHR